MNDHVTDVYIPLIQSVKGSFLPSQEKYIAFVFEYSCRIMEYYGYRTNEVEEVMAEYFQRDYDRARQRYFKTDQQVILRAPTTELEFQKMFWSDIKTGFSRDILNGLEKILKKKKKG